MSLTVDHALFAWPDHEEVMAAADAVGFDPEYGGEHDGGETQNALVAFPDGSYLEFMTPTEPGTRPDRWAGLVDHWRGPATWCIRAEVRDLLARALAAGTPVEGPTPGRRDRPDGTTVEWITGRYGPQRLRGVLPFAIADRTPRAYRVPETAVLDGPLAGIEKVLVGVDAVAEPMDWFRRLHDCPTPVDVQTSLPAEVSTVPGQPLAFVRPDPGSALADRHANTGDQPLAFLVGTADFDAAADRFTLTTPGSLGDRRLAWFDAAPLRATVGVVETT